MREVRLIQLGITAHEQIDAQMRSLQQQRIAEEIPDTLMLVEHPEVVTIGPKARNDIRRIASFTSGGAFLST